MTMQSVFSSNAYVRKANASSDQSSDTHPQLLGVLPAAWRTSETSALEEKHLVRFLLQENENPRTGGREAHERTKWVLQTGQQTVTQGPNPAHHLIFTAPSRELPLQMTSGN